MNEMFQAAFPQKSLRNIGNLNKYEIEMHEHLTDKILNIEKVGKDFGIIELKKKLLFYNRPIQIGYQQKMLQQIIQMKI